MNILLIIIMVLTAFDLGLLIYVTQNYVLVKKRKVVKKPKDLFQSMGLDTRPVIEQLDEVFGVKH